MQKPAILPKTRFGFHKHRKVWSKNPQGGQLACQTMVVGKRQSRKEKLTSLFIFLPVVREDSNSATPYSVKMGILGPLPR